MAALLCPCQSWEKGANRMACWHMAGAEPHQRLRKRGSRSVSVCVTGQGAPDRA